MHLGPRGSLYAIIGFPVDVFPENFLHPFIMSWLNFLIVG